MQEINFKYNNQTFPIKCNLDDKIKDVCKIFAEKNSLEIDNLIFINQGTQINFKLDLLVEQEFNLPNNQQNQILKTEELLVYENPFFIKLTCDDYPDYIIKVTLKAKMKDILDKYAESKKFEVNKIYFIYNDDIFLYNHICNKTVNAIINKTDKRDRVLCAKIFILEDNSLDSIDKTLNIDEEIIKNSKKYDKNIKSIPSKSNIIHNEQSENINDISVTKWMDYTSKYGLGYVLSNGHVGLYFNDGTKIIYRPNGTNFIYIEGKADKNTEIRTTHTLSEEFSKDLNKKVILMKHFKDELLKENENIQIETKESENIYEKQYVFIKKWLVTKEAIAFYLSNHSVQVTFFDKSEIFVSSNNKTVKYLDKKGQMNVYTFNTALESNDHEVTKRLHYMKKMLEHIHKHKSNKSGDKMGEE